MKTVLVTGASRGIGKEIAKEFAKNGYNVAINYNNSKQQAEELCLELNNMGCNAILVKAVLSNEEEVKQMINTVVMCFGHIDVLVNNAGISYKGLLIDESDDCTKHILDINLLGSILTSKYVLQNMLKYQNGKIINISSIWGNCGASCEATYSASKAGLIGLTKSLAKEYGYNGITVNCICPGVVDTDMNKNLTNQEMQDIIENIPSGRLCTTKEIAELVLYLSSSKGEYINGQIITIDGGFTL